MSTKIKTHIQCKRATQANWESSSVTYKPLEGEIIIYLPDSSHTKPRIKVGNGSSLPKDLPFATEYTLTKSGNTITLKDGAGNVSQVSVVGIGTSAGTAYDGAQGAATTANLTAHTSAVNNPHSVTKSQVGLGNVDNTSDANKPVSTATQTALDGKVDKVSGKGLSTNDYTTTEKNKLSGIANGAEVNQNAFSKISDGTSTIEADSKTDTLTIVGGTNTTVTYDTTNDKITISSTNTTYNNATTSTAGLMSSLDKTKLNEIATGAEVNQNAFSNVKVGSTTVAADTETDTLELVAGSNITLTADATNDKVTIAATDTKYSAGTGIGLSGTTFSNAGVRSITQDSSDKHKLTVNTNGTSTTITIPDNNTTYSAGTGISLSGTTFSNSGVHSISTGTTNGTISVNTNGTSANVAVKGLGSAAYTASSAYDAAGAANTALSSAKTYTDEKVAALVNGAPETLDTLDELAAALDDNADILDTLNAAISNKADKTHTHNYAGSSSEGGAATSANKLNTNAGSATQPVYFSGGVPVATTYTLGKSVPSNAVFTDTTYSTFVESGSSAAAGLVPAPSTTAGTSKYLREDGTWTTPPNTTYSVATTSANGLMSSSDKSKLDGVAANANNYTHPTYTSKASGLYKITVNGTGHVSAATAVSKSDITGLGIPSENTTYSTATSSTAGLVKVSSVNSSAVTVNSESTTTGRYYPVELNSDGKAIVNVPWTDNNTNYYHTTGSWNGLTYTATANGDAGTLAFTIPTGSSSTTVALGNHTHSYMPLSGGTFTGDVTMTAGETFKLNTLNIPTSSGGTTYGAGTSGQVLKTNGTTVYWASDNNTNYYPTRSYTSGLQISSYIGNSNCALYVPYATYTQVGAVKTAYSTTGTATLTTATNTFTTSPTIATRGTTSGRYYAVETDSTGLMYVNVPWSNTNTYGLSSNTSSKIYLIGRTSQSSSSGTTYSHDTVYVGTDGCLYSNSAKVVTVNDSITIDDGELN